MTSSVREDVCDRKGAYVCEVLTSSRFALSFPQRLESVGEHRREFIAYAAAVVTGTVCIVIACLNQPYNQNELQQIAPYGSNDVSAIIHATRQPPLDPLLGAAVQHLLGQGQLRQRLIPGIAGIITLVLLALLLRRLHIGIAGIVAIWLTATAPLLIRYSAYSRPYSVPLMLMVVYVYAAERYAETRSRWLLVLLALSAVAMPLTRVPEPDVFLGVTLVVTAWRAWRHHLDAKVAIPLVAVPFAAIAFVGYPLFHSLSSKTGKVFDPSISGIVHRFPEGVHETFTGFLPLLSHYLPWWPLLVATVLAGVALPVSRRHLVAWWYFWPLLAAPVVFALAYHFLNPYSFAIRPYRARMAIFFVPAVSLLVAAVTDALVHLVRDRSVWIRTVAAVFVGGLIVTQLPSTVRALVDNEAPDYAQAADVLTHDLPANSIVLYDTVSIAGQWRQPFSAKPRYMGDVPFVGTVSTLMKTPGKVPRTGPVYVLIMDSVCSTSVVCDGHKIPWDRRVPGWHVQQRFDRFTLYAANAPIDGRQGAIRAMATWGRDLTPGYGYVETFVAAALAKRVGEIARSHQLIDQMYATATPYALKLIKKTAAKKHMDPFA